MNFKVISSNPNKKDGFVTKIHRETTVKHPIFGNKVKRETYYISGTTQLAVDSEIPGNVLEDFRVQERQMLLEDTGEIIPLKWLHLK